METVKDEIRRTVFAAVEEILDSLDDQTLDVLQEDEVPICLGMLVDDVPDSSLLYIDTSATDDMAAVAFSIAPLASFMESTQAYTEPAQLQNLFGYWCGALLDELPAQAMEPVMKAMHHVTGRVCAFIRDAEAKGRRRKG